MIRRLRMACVGLGICMVPACLGKNELSDPYYTGGGPGYVLMNRPGVPNGMYQQKASDRTTGLARQNPSADQKFGPTATGGNPTQLADAAQLSKPVRTVDPVNALAEKQVGFEQPAPIESPLSDRKQWPPLAVDEKSEGTASSPMKNVTAPEWPSFGPKKTEEKATTHAPPDRLPALDLPPPAVKEPPVIAPTQGSAIDPPVNMGTSMKVSEPVAPLAATSSTDETVLLRAMKAYQSNHPEVAVDLLKRLDPTNQEVLLSLMPLIVRLGEGNLNSMTPDELALMIDRLQLATGMLKSKASLRIDRAIFCRGVRKFADIDPYDARHEFRPGDMVFLYAELKNFTCEPVQVAGSQPGGAKQRGYHIRLGASLEMRDARNNLVWRTDLAKNDVAQTPPQDYYHTYRFCVPERLAPGTYTLWLTVIDKPTNRAIRKPVELRVTQG